jgi:ADP-dependent NAD(P)H-hydrate dehydratase / NAD(P)H-hydrate epimerase
MLDVLTAEDVRRQDAACEARGISTESLMSTAGFAVARAARRMLGGTYGRRVVVVCGKGNNAGDGLVAGRVLRSWAASVTAVLLLGNEFEGAAASAFERFPGHVLGLDALGRELGRADLVIDAIFGVGLARAPEGAAAEAISVLSGPTLRVLALDVPSGVSADTGALAGAAAVRAELTVTLGGLKPGLLFEPGRSFAGRVEFADIGVPDDLRAGSAWALEASDVRAAMPRRGSSSNKRNVGTVLLVVGSRGLPGAAALAAGGSVHGGAGLTIVAAPESVVPTIIARVPEVTAIPLPETGDGTIDPKAIELIRPRLKEFHVAALGPGLSTHPATAELVRALVTEIDVPMVLDADALTAMKGSAGLVAQRSAPTVVTPHTREMSRLVGVSVEEIESDRLGAARRAAAELGCVVLLKGPGTVIAAPDGSAYLTPTGGPSLAQGGTGDVLTGLTAALLAQEQNAGAGRAAPLTTAVSAWIHGRAGDLAAERLAPHPANASLLIELIGEVMHEVAG